MSVMAGVFPSQSDMVFAGVKIPAPLAASMQKLNLLQPSPIQQSSILPLSSGSSTLLHAATGTGKTLAYVLPALKRLYSHPTRQPFQVLILVPTKELALQVTADILSLVGEEEKWVSLCIDNMHKAKVQDLAPIVVGTPFKVWNLMSHIHPEDRHLLKQLEYLVLDEVDRLIVPPNRYLSPTSPERQDKREKGDKGPVENIAALLSSIHFPSSGRPQKPWEHAKPYVKSEPSEQSEQALTEALQVVGASATVGRPLRREMHRIFSSSDGYGGLFEVLRPAEANTITLRKQSEKNKTKQDGSDEEEDEREGKAKNGADEKLRLVTIPPGIDHLVLLDGEDRQTLASKLGIIKNIWQQQQQGGRVFKRGLVFVPKPEDVDHAVGIMRFWRVAEVKSLLSTFGLENIPAFASEKKDKDKKGAQFVGTRITQPVDQLLVEARKHGIGAAGSALSSQSDDRVLFVAPFSGTRGLHIEDIDVIFIVEAPRSMDEYLHLAGRTGRMSLKNKKGMSDKDESVVATITNLDGLKRLYSWQTALDISFRMQPC
eukprot:gene2296-2515_t